MFEKQNCWHTLETAGCFAFQCAFSEWIQIGLQRNMFPPKPLFSNKPQLFHCPCRIVFSNIVCDSENPLPQSDLIQLNLWHFMYLPHGLGRTRYYSGLTQCIVADACLPDCTVSSQKIVKCRARLQKTITLMWERERHYLHCIYNIRINVKALH